MMRPYQSMYGEPPAKRRKVESLEPITKYRFNDDWRLAKHDNALSALVESLKAPSAFVQRCLDTLQAQLQNIFPRVIIIPRGSFASSTSMQLKYDLDVDVIFPFDYLHQAPLRSCSYFLERYHENNEKNLQRQKLENQFATAFIEFVQSAAQTLLDSRMLMLISSKNNNLDQQSSMTWQCYLSQPVEEVTRSLPLIVVMDGIRIEVDLFPKVVQSNGTVVWAGPELNFTPPIRTVLKQQFNQILKQRDIYSPLHHGVILLLKYWKSTHQEDEVRQIIKSYHFLVCIDEIQKLPDKYAKILSQSDALSLNKRNVVMWMDAILNLLTQVYTDDTLVMDEDLSIIRNETVNAAGAPNPIVRHTIITAIKALRSSLASTIRGEQ